MDSECISYSPECILAGIQFSILKWKHCPRKEISTHTFWLMIKKTFIPIYQKYIYMVLKETTESPKEMWSKDSVHVQKAHHSHGIITFPSLKTQWCFSRKYLCSAVYSLWLQTDFFGRSVITVYFSYNSVDSFSDANEKELSTTSEFV